MKAELNDLLSVAESKSLTYQQKLFNMANTAERLIDPRELLDYTQEEYDYLCNHMICDLNEGYAAYRPRYTVPDYNVFIKNGCNFLDLPVPKDLDELLDSLLILYHHVPSVTSFPVYIGDLDQLINPFLTNEEVDYIKIKRFLNHIDKTIVDSFCHADIGPERTKAGELILRAVIELENPTPNITFKYREGVDEDFFKMAIESCLKVSKPSFSHDEWYTKDVGPHAIVSCYNALPLAGGAYTLSRLRLGTIASQAESLSSFILNVLPKVSRCMLSMMDKRIKYMVEKSNFFESNFLVQEGFIKKENFTGMFGIVGLADAVNHFLELEGCQERYGHSERGDVIGKQIMDLLDEIVKSHYSPYLGRTNHQYLLHGQVGANLSDEDYHNTPAHRIPVGDEPMLVEHLIHSSKYHGYFPSGTGDLFAFDQTYLDHLDALSDIIKGSFRSGMRYITTYMHNTDLIRITGYLIKKSEVNKVNQDEVVLRDTDILGSGSNKIAHLFERRVRKSEQ